VHPATAGGEMTHYAVGEPAGPTDSCAGSPYAPDAPTGTDRDAVNAANEGTDLVVKGRSQPGVSAVTVTIADAAGKTVARPAVVAGTSWTATFPGAGVATLGDGALEVSGKYKIAAGTFHGATMSIAKDTVAPAAPTASVPAGAYGTPQQVRLAGESGATVRYTTDGSDPTAASTAADRPIGVAGRQTLRAIAVDAAGNASPVASFDYAIAPAAVPVVRNAAAGLRLQGLRVGARLRLRAAHRRGIRVLLTAPSGAKVVRVRLMRGRRVVTQVVRQVKGNRLMSVVLPRTRKGRRHLRAGTYRVLVTPGLSARELGATSSRTVRIR
jgi:hypothetical protein